MEIRSAPKTLGGRAIRVVSFAKIQPSVSSPQLRSGGNGDGGGCSPCQQHPAETLPHPDADRLAAVWNRAPGAPGLTEVSGGLRLSLSIYVTYAEENRTFEHVGVG